MSAAETQPGKGYTSIAGVAEHLDVSKDTVRRLIGSGELRASKVRRQYRIRWADLEAYAARRAVKR